MKYVIIGNSAAGIGAVEGIRKIDAIGKITIISSELHHTYARPLISYYLSEKVTKDTIKYRGDSFYEDNHCSLLLGKTATDIVPAKKIVMLNDGSSIPYDKLLVATGSSPATLPIEGLDTAESVYTFTSLNDAHKISEDENSHGHILIIGAGLIGLKCAEGLSRRAASITVVGLAPTVLSSILDEQGAVRIQKHLEGKGITFMLSTSVTAVNGKVALLQNGQTISYDLLVIAVGVRPNTGLLNGIANIERGILINERSETTADSIYAAGDCVQTTDASSGESKVMALLPNAYMQGECAGINMAGGSAVWNKNIPMNAIGFFGLNIITAGNYVGAVYEASDEKSYKRLFYSGDCLNGYIMIGNVQKAGIYTEIIRERTPLSKIDFELICENPGLMAFSTRDRAFKLGGIQ